MSRFRTIAHLVLALIFSMPSSSVRAFTAETSEDYVIGNQTSEMASVGILKAGSIVEIPDEFKVEEAGRINVAKSLEQWEKSGTVVNANYTDQFSKTRTEKFFQVKISKAAEGSSVPSGQSQFFISLQPEKLKALEIPITEDMRIFVNNNFTEGNSETEAIFCVGCNTAVQSPTSEKAAAPIIAAIERAQQVQEVARPAAPIAAPPTPIAVPPVVVHTEPPRPPPVIQETAEAAPAPAAPRLPSPPKAVIKLQKLSPAFANQCRNFITKSGELGPWGRILVSEMKKYPIFTNPKNKVEISYRVGDKMEAICPMYQQMSKQEKYLAMTWVMTAVADIESDCEPSGLNRNATNGRAIGLFQMEEKDSTRQGGGRGPACRGHLNMFDAATNIACATSIMSDVLEKGRGLANPDWNYWQPLRSRSKKDLPYFLNRMKQYQPCFRR